MKANDNGLSRMGVRDALHLARALAAIDEATEVLHRFAGWERDDPDMLCILAARGMLVMAFDSHVAPARQDHVRTLVKMQPPTSLPSAGPEEAA